MESKSRSKMIKFKSCKSANEITQYCVKVPQSLGKVGEKIKMAPCHLSSYDYSFLATSPNKLLNPKQCKRHHPATDVIEELHALSYEPAVIKHSNGVGVETECTSRNEGLSIHPDKYEVQDVITDEDLLSERKRGTKCQKRKLYVMDGQCVSKCTNACQSECTVSGWREEQQGSVLGGCLEEIKASNPVFPMRKIFAALQKKYKECLQDCSSEAEKNLNTAGAKQKLRNESEVSGNILKRPRCDLGVAEVTGHLPSLEQTTGSTVPLGVGLPRRSRLSRTHRMKQPMGSGGQAEDNCVKPNPRSHVELRRSLGCLARDNIFEDVLWTQKYSPRHSSEVISNSNSVKKLHSWLKKWKFKADCEERLHEVEIKRGGNSNDSWDCGDFQGETRFKELELEQLCNTILITGPSGVGKTASVYACALELGFKVFEVNASSQRSGRHVLTQLQEATQSHLVENQGNNYTLKPTYLTSYTCSAITPDPLPGKSVSHKKALSTSKKRYRRKRNGGNHGRKSNQAAVTLANFWKMKCEVESLHLDLPSENAEARTSGILLPGTDKLSTLAHNKKMATSLILFEEVDIIFDNDVGFLAAIKKFMTTTKRPVIMTSNDPSFRAMFDNHLEEIVFKTPTMANVCSYLQLLCLTEKVRTDPSDITWLLRLTQGDVRRSLLQLQLWVRSGGGQPARRAALLQDPVEDVKKVLLWDTGCSSSMLGLLTSGPCQDLLSLLKCQSWSGPDMVKLLTVLAESWRNGVPLLYSNLELLLPLPVKVQESPIHYPKKHTCTRLQRWQTTPGNGEKRGKVDQPSIIRTLSRLSRKKSAISDSKPLSNILLKPRGASLLLKKIQIKGSNLVAKPKIEQSAMRLTATCLGIVTDFLDLMSHLDASMPNKDTPRSGSFKPKSFNWSGVKLKDGLLDEMREEERGCSKTETLLEIQAAIEGFGFRRCLERASRVWSEAQKWGQEVSNEQWGAMVEDLTLPVPCHRQNITLSPPCICESSMASKSYRLSRAVLSSRAFSTLGRSQAVLVDYMPFLRSICRSERTQNRSTHYLNSIQLGLSKSTIQLLSEDFP